MRGMKTPSCQQKSSHKGSSYTAFLRSISRKKAPVVLLEGRRELRVEDHPRLKEVAHLLAQRFPHAIFRTGNARGSDTLFAEGICRVDPRRLEYILPYRGMGATRAAADSATLCLEDVSDELEEEIRRLCREASPLKSPLFQQPHWEIRERYDHFSAKYLLRDALKVTGDRTQGFAPATCAILYVEPGDPNAGGTGHTLRLCHRNQIPSFTQEEWFQWLE